jgi:protein SCO1/2
MSQPRKVVAWVWLIFFLGLIIGSVVWMTVFVETMKKKPAQPPIMGSISRFTLQDQDGRPMSPVQLRGKIWVADFIFTRCGGPCPLMSSKMAELQGALGDRRAELVSFSVDPEYDQPAILKKYAQHYGAKPGKWHFLTGRKEEITRLLREDFKIGFEQTDGPPETAIVHGSHFVLVDGEGRIRGYYGVLEDETPVRGEKDPINRIIADIDAMTAPLP